MTGVATSNGFISHFMQNDSTGNAAVTRFMLGNDTSTGAAQFVVYGGNHATLPNVVDLNNANNAALRLLANNAVVAQVNPTGLAVTGLTDISAATSGQIKFPATQNASSDANTLDDYEEGTWTPAVTFGGAAVGVTYGASNAGQYVKVGRMMTVCGILELTSKGSSTGNISITGLPVAGNIFGGAALTLYGLTFTGQAYGQPNASAMVLYQINAGTRTVLTNTAFQNDTSISIQITYYV